jgi:hypothetical protein
MNGNRLSLNLRIPGAYVGQRRGALLIKSTARLTSYTNRVATISLRSRYHANAATYSSLAAP